MKKQPIYMYQCIVCRENFYTENTIMKHCGKLTQWINGIDGKGVDMESPKVKIKVSGYVIMTKENLDNLMNYGNPHQAITYALHMGYVDIANLEYEPEE